MEYIYIYIYIYLYIGSIRITYCMLERNRVLDTLDGRAMYITLIKMFFLTSTLSFTLFGDLQVLKRSASSNLLLLSSWSTLNILVGYIAKPPNFVKITFLVLKDECPVDALRASVLIYLTYILKNNVEFRRK